MKNGHRFHEGLPRARRNLRFDEISVSLSYRKAFKHCLSDRPFPIHSPSLIAPETSRKHSLRFLPPFFVVSSMSGLPRPHNVLLASLCNTSRIALLQVYTSRIFLVRFIVDYSGCSYRIYTSVSYHLDVILQLLAYQPVINEHCTIPICAISI